MGSEREYPVFSLPAGPIPWGIHDQLMRLIDKFEPLRFEAAEKAKAWLETNVAAGKLPFETHLAFSEDGEELFGFFVLTDEDIEVAPQDVPIMMVRKTIDDPEAPTQQAMKLVWIARSVDSDAGFGNELFDHALVLALEAGGCALVVEPYDEETAEKLWIKHFLFRKPRRGAPGWRYLWYPLGTPNQDFC